MGNITVCEPFAGAYGRRTVERRGADRGPTSGASLVMARKFPPSLGRAKGYVALLDAVALRIPGYGSDESLNDLLPEASLLLLALTEVKLPRKELT